MYVRCDASLQAGMGAASAVVGLSDRSAADSEALVLNYITTCATCTRVDFDLSNFHD